MSHIDEGRLHAWLDGALGPQSGPDGAALAAHLEECAVCRTRLEEERAVRDRARAVLSAADSAPSAAPPFADLVAQARSNEPTPERAGEPYSARATARSSREPARRRTSRIGLAWAASIAMAVGAGFLGRELMLQRGRDLPAELDFGRESIEAPADAVEGQRENAPAAPEPAASDPSRRQKSEAKAIVEAEKPMADRGAETREADVSERLDADLAEVAAAPAAERAPEAVGRVEEEEISGRARFAARPPATGVASGHPAIGCWRAESGQKGGEIATRLRLSDELRPDAADGVRRLETDPDLTQSGSDAPGWLPLGADSVWLSIPPRIFRMKSGDDVLEGLVSDPAGPSAEVPSEVRFMRIECGTP